MRSTYSETRFLVRMEELKAEARLLLRRSQTPLALLRTIDSMERLGVAYHFQEEIKRALDHYYESCYSSAGSCEEVALGFRLLRQHGHRVSSERLHCGFKDLTMDPKNISSQEIRCVLELYEASHLATCGESNVGEIKDLVSTHLKSLVGRVEGDLAQLVQHSLEMPFHWMMPRLEAQRYIDVYAGKEDRDPVLFELAKLDFNMVQAVHQRELRELSRWWTGLGLIESLPFSRDRLVENYLWAMGVAFEPQFSNVRVWLTKLVCILTVIDDIYDVYGTFDELELFTNVVESWKTEAAEMLPEYMKACFLALHSLVNETAHEISRIQGWDALPFVCKEWQRLCKGYFLEAKWFNNCYKSTLTEYLENAWITVGGPIAMVHAYLLRTTPIPHELADCLGSNQCLKLIYLSSMITRISDDLGTSRAEMERGDILKTLECFMEDSGESEDNSREHIKGLVGELWMELNEECHENTELPQDFLRMVVNMSRAAQCIFQYGDGIGTSTGVTKDRIISLFVEGIE
ncbi:hypothetical protein Taro_054083 [Colocasia esculenta]|uniref:Uncharacterized protein n=1 Tax=Colocasia esculenta TaxID=4460 RepID=A0A843XPI4_COLES|nr:hypothetical protein [Colocasia esculenta]